MRGIEPNTPVDATTRRFEVSRWRRRSHWVRIVGAAAFVLVGPLVVLQTPDQPWWFLALWVPICGATAWGVTRRALAVTVHGDGTVVFERAVGRVHTRADRIRRVRRERSFAQGSTPGTRFVTEDGWVTTDADLPTFDLVSALRAVHPGLPVEL